MYIKLVKRLLDIFFSLTAGLMLSWLLLVIFSFYIALFQFPILFTQKRIGRNNQPFIIYKFRTLHESEESDLNKRRFWWGDLLRFFSLDELPQVWNVLRGEMS